MNKKEFKPGGFFANILFTIENNNLNYRSAYGSKFSVPVSNISAISSTPAGSGKSQLIITGSGSELARSEAMPVSWVEKTINWINGEIDLSQPKKATSESNDPLAALEKLNILLQKNLITQSDYDQKKAEILSKL